MTKTAGSHDISRRHDALFYHGVDEYVGAIASFVRGGLVSSEPALVAVPHPKDDLLQAVIGSASRVNFVDMADLGRNPARIIPRIRSFVYANRGRPTRVVHEPVWLGRPDAEVGEVILHESLLERAVAGSNISILCPYDSADLHPAALANATRSHSHLIDHGGRRESLAYDRDLAAARFTTPLPPAPAYAKTMGFGHGDLARLRHFVEEGATRAGLGPDRSQDLGLAVSEVATNALVHAGPPGLIRLWLDIEAMEVICALYDDGHIAEPLVGRLGPYPVAKQGWGLWMVNQLCDLVELRSGAWGTNVRLHMRAG
jgi:anti-sigma regulatory factor (Ser/Thr protein kinase)